MRSQRWGLLFIGSVSQEICFRGEQGEGQQLLGIDIYQFLAFNYSLVNIWTLKRSKSTNKES